jgi:hypothetical protein
LGIDEIGEYLLLWRRLEHIKLTNQADTMISKWNNSGTYTAGSCYKATFLGCTMSDAWRLTWKTWAPRASSSSTGWPTSTGAGPLLAFNAEASSTTHAACSATRRWKPSSTCFSHQVWHLSWLRATCSPSEQEDTLLSWWNKAKHATPKPLRKGLAPWLIWKQRNDCVLNGAEPSIHNVVTKIRDEAALWARASASGLRVLLPQNWDVH